MTGHKQRHTKPEPDAELARLWSGVVSLFVERRDAMFAVLGRHGLTPPHGHALSMLGSGPARMRDMAEHMACDASYITAVVDRLEALGFAERRASAADRRVKEIALTPAGQRASDEIRATMMKPPDSFARLSSAERAILAELMVKIVPDADPSTDPFRPGPRRAA